MIWILFPPLHTTRNVLTTLNTITAVHPAAPLFPNVFLCHSTLSRLLTIMFLPEQFPNLPSETTLLLMVRAGCLRRVWAAEEDQDLSSPVEYLPFYPVWPSANRVLFQMVCLMHTVHVYGCTVQLIPFQTLKLQLMDLCFIKKYHWELPAEWVWYFAQLSWRCQLRFPVLFWLIKTHRGPSNQDVWDKTARWRSASFPAVIQTKWRGCLRIPSTAPVSQSVADVIFSLSGCEKNVMLLQYFSNVHTEYHSARTDVKSRLKQEPVRSSRITEHSDMKATWFTLNSQQWYSTNHCDILIILSVGMCQKPSYWCKGIFLCKMIHGPQ